jgi:4-amino-4-deoxy-L-arabinose transferase-like glycosyltransferase
VLAVVIVAVAARVLVFALGHPFPPLAKDDSVYDLLAVNMLEGHGFSISTAPPYEPMAARTPGYPAFLAGVYTVAGHSPDAVRVVQIALAAITCLLIYALARQFLSHAAAVLAAMVYATLPAAAAYPSLVLTESVQALLLTWALYLAYRCTEAPRTVTWYAGCGLILGLATLVRPDYQLLLIPLLMTVVWLGGQKSAGAVRAAVALACFAVVVLPWVGRNYSTFGRFVGLATGSGHVLLVAQLEAEGKTGRALDDELQARYGARFRERYHREMTYLDGALPDQDEIRRRDFMAFLASQPTQYIEHTAQRLAVFWGPRSWSDAVGVDGDFSEYRRSRAFGPLVVKAVMLLWDAVVIGFAAVGAVFAVRAWRKVLPIVCVVVYATAIHSLVYAGARYRVPILPFVAILASVGIQGAALLVSRRASGLSTLFEAGEQRHAA